jgi:hypothetical protein
LKEVADFALVEYGPRMEANILLALLAPKKGAAAAEKKPRPASQEASQEGTSG